LQLLCFGQTGTTRAGIPDDSMTHNRRLSAAFIILAATAFLTACDSRPKEFVRPKPVMVFQPKDMTDSLAALIAAQREVYASNIVQRLTRDGVIPPAHLLSDLIPNVAARGVEFHFVGRSLWPINPRNAPQTETERTGLEFIAANPGKNFYGEESLGGRRYFTAIYPDRAVVPVCISCHNSHPQSARKDFLPGAVMGGIVVRVPLEL
jgi:hypothetical protein